MSTSDGESQYRALLEQMGEGFALCRVNFQNGRAVECICEDANPAFERHCGLARQRLVGRALDEVLPGGNWSDRLGQVVQTGHPMRVEQPLEGGASLRVVAYRPKPGYAALVLQNPGRAEIPEANPWVRGLCHDLRTPLSVLLMQTELLGRTLSAEGDKSRRRVATIQGSGLQLARILEDFGELLALEEGTLRLSRRPLHLDRFTDAAISRLSASLPIERICRHIEPELPALQADPERLERMLRTLLENALNYSPAQSPVVLRASLERGAICLSVADQGEGIAPELQPHLFDRPFRSSAGGRRGGLGMGLYLCGQLARLHGGATEVESHRGRGSVFRLRFPVSA